MLPAPCGGKIITSTLRKHQYFIFNELGRPNYLSRLLISEIVKYGCSFDGNRVSSEMGIFNTQSIKQMPDRGNGKLVREKVFKKENMP